MRHWSVVFTPRILTINFFPSPGRISLLRTPSGPGVRDDTGIYEGWTVPVFYDPLLSKLVTWGKDRVETIARMQRALREYQVAGIKTNLSFFRSILSMSVSGRRVGHQFHRQILLSGNIDPVCKPSGRGHGCGRPSRKP